MGSFNWIGEYNAAVTIADDAALPAPSPAPTRRSKRLPRAKKLDFLGWGSKQLIEFLHSIGKDTTKQINQNDVARVILEYVNHNKLLHPTKKKRIVCDEALRSLFGRKTIGRNKIHDLLQPHFADNLEEDSSDSSDEEEEEDEPSIKKLQRKKQRTRPALHAPPPPPKSCFAAVISENLKLVYLRRSVVEALVKESEAEPFEEKVVGSFVRTKSDPHDYMQKNPYQLMQVKAVLKKPNSNSESSGGGGGGGVLLQLHGAVKDLPVSMLSDDNFTPEECEDLRERVKRGSLERPKVVELQQKVQILHVDVTKHWLVREIQYLQKSIDRFNEKGQRRELYECLEKKQLLQSPDEQARLLRDVPEVIAEELEVEPNTQDEIEQGNHGSPGQILRGDSISIHSEACEDGDSLLDWQQQPAECIKRILDEPKQGIVEDNKALEQPIDKHVTSSEIVDLTADDNDSEERECEQKYEIPIPELSTCMWHYIDPQGNVQGPFSIISLKRWSDSDYFTPDFKIWKTGQSRDEALLLTKILRCNFIDKSVYQ